MESRLPGSTESRSVKDGAASGRFADGTHTTDRAREIPWKRREIERRW
ncbi:hypothetical protein OB905_13320 [Halobacteria archaeon AArc-dxtr1]|nr:hypothetical protein [Halobacteria archaeon AArc-dxtr1]